MKNILHPLILGQSRNLGRYMQSRRFFDKPLTFQRSAFINFSPFNQKIQFSGKVAKYKKAYISIIGISLSTLLFMINQQTRLTDGSEKKAWRVLTLDGGGIRGILTLNILREIEYRIGKPITEIFDFFAGTSTGGIIALGLNKKKPYIEESTFSNKIPELTSEQSKILYEILQKKDVIDRNGDIQNVIDEDGNRRYDFETLDFPTEYLEFKEQIIEILREPGSYRDTPQYTTSDLLQLYEKRGTEIFDTTKIPWIEWVEWIVLRGAEVVTFPLLGRIFKAFVKGGAFVDVPFPNAVNCLVFFTFLPIIFLPSILLSAYLASFGAFCTITYPIVFIANFYFKNKSLTKELAKVAFVSAISLLAKFILETNIYTAIMARNFQDEVMRNELLINHVLTLGLHGWGQFWRIDKIFHQFLIGTKYSATSLERLLLEYFGNTTLQQTYKPVLVTSYNISEDRLESFSNFKDDKGNDRYSFIKMREAARATSSAPTYFEPATIEDYDLTLMPHNLTTLERNKLYVRSVDNGNSLEYILLPPSGGDAVRDTITQSELTFKIPKPFKLDKLKPFSQEIFKITLKRQQTTPAKSYIDGGVCANDPSEEALAVIQSSGHHIDYLLPVGTGVSHKPKEIHNFSMGALFQVPNLFKVLFSQAGTEQRIQLSVNGRGGQKIQIPLSKDVQLDDVSNETIKFLNAAAKDYIRQQEEDDKLDNICAALDKNYIKRQKKFFWAAEKNDKAHPPVPINGADPKP